MSNPLIDPESIPDPASTTPEVRERKIFSQGGLIPNPDPREPSDPIFTEMVRLASLPIQERLITLEPYVMTWLDMQVDRFVIAGYLAAAGLKYEEAMNLKFEVGSRFSQSLRMEAYTGIGAGMLLFVTGGWVLLLRVFPFWGILACVLACAGMLSLTRGIGLLRRVVPVDEWRAEGSVSDRN